MRIVLPPTRRPYRRIGSATSGGRPGPRGAAMGFITPSPPPFDLEEWKAKPAPGAAQAARPGLGGQRLRHADGGLPALRRQADRVRRSARFAADRGDHARARRARRLRRLVDRADRLPEARRLDAALGDPRASAAGRCRSTFRFLPPIGGVLYWLRPGNRAPAAVARQGAAHRAAPRRTLARRRALRRRARVAPSTCCSPTARRSPGLAAGRLDPAAIAVLLGLLGAARPARQGPLPGRPRPRSTACCSSSSCSRSRT